MGSRGHDIGFHTNQLPLLRTPTLVQSPASTKPKSFQRGKSERSEADGDGEEWGGSRGRDGREESGASFEFEWGTQTDSTTFISMPSNGYMHQAQNNARATHSGFGFISPENLFKVCQDSSWRISARCDMICQPLQQMSVGEHKWVSGSINLRRDTFYWKQAFMTALTTWPTLCLSPAIYSLVILECTQ